MPLLPVYSRHSHKNLNNKYDCDLPTRSPTPIALLLLRQHLVFIMAYKACVIWIPGISLNFSLSTFFVFVFSAVWTCQTQSHPRTFAKAVAPVSKRFTLDISLSLSLYSNLTLLERPSVTPCSKITFQSYISLWHLLSDMYLFDSFFLFLPPYFILSLPFCIIVFCFVNQYFVFLFCTWIFLAPK